MIKILKNVTDNSILLSDVGKTISSGQEFNTEGRQDTFINSDNTLTAIRNGYLQVGDGSKFYTNALEGEAYFRTRFDDNAFLIDGSEVIEFTPEIVTDTPTGKKATNLFMDILTMLKEFYNAPGDPLYEEGFQPLLGESGREVEHLGRTLNLEVIHGDTGWHRREIKSYGYQAPLNLLIYYGWTNSFNYAINSWDNEKVAQDMARYNLIIFGDGIQDPSHGDHENAHTIINRIKVLNPQTKIFGYVTCNQTYANFQTKTDQWNDMQVHGIFMDECGYDYGTTRDAFNQKVSYVHGKAYSNICFVNAWNMDHIIGTENDPSYPNSTYNAGLSASNLTSDDWYLLESFPINTTAFSGSGGYETKTDWKTRGDKAISHRNTYGINLAGVGIINNDNGSGQSLFNFGYISSLMYALEAFGTSDTSYGSSSATVTFWTRPNVLGLGRIWFNSVTIAVDTGDADVYYRYTDFAKLKVDFSTGAQASSITRFSNIT